MLKGCITALVTPFKDQDIDYKSLSKMLDFQLNQGIKAFVINGTTGESPTLSLDEKRKVLKYVIAHVPKGVSIVAGVSSNNTVKMIEEIKNIEDLNFNHLLISTPYYNKTTQEGLILHIKQAIKYTEKNIILYNIPSRCGMNFDISTLEVLIQEKQITGIKEASGDLNYAQILCSKFSNKLDIYCGNDDLAYIYGTLGASGVISATGNIYGSKFNDMFNFLEKNDYQSAKNINVEIMKLNILLFEQVNPILVKGLLAKLNLIENELRLPLVTGDEYLLEKIIKEYKEVIG